jgi:hypothetical protein
VRPNPVYLRVYHYTLVIRCTDCDNLRRYFEWRARNRVVTQRDVEFTTEKSQLHERLAAEFRRYETKLADDHGEDTDAFLQDDVENHI